MKITEPEPLSPYDNHEEKLKRQICRPDNPDDAYEATLREFLAVYTIIARRVSRQLFEEEIAVTGAPYDARTNTDKIPPTLTAHLRLTREIRAQHRYLNNYIKNPMPTEDSNKDSDREGRVHSCFSRPRPSSHDQHHALSAKKPPREAEPTREPQPKPTQQPTQPPKPKKIPAKTGNKNPTAPRPVILLPEPTPKNPRHPEPIPPESLKIAAARKKPDQPTREDLLREGRVPPRPFSQKQHPPP